MKQTSTYFIVICAGLFLSACSAQLPSFSNNNNTPDVDSQEIPENLPSDIEAAESVPVSTYGATPTQLPETFPVE